MRQGPAQHALEYASALAAGQSHATGGNPLLKAQLANLDQHLDGLLQKSTPGFQESGAAIGSSGRTGGGPLPGGLSGRGAAAVPPTVSPKAAAAFDEAMLSAAFRNEPQMLSIPVRPGREATGHVARGPGAGAADRTLERVLQGLENQAFSVGEAVQALEQEFRDRSRLEVKGISSELAATASRTKAARPGETTRKPLLQPTSGNFDSGYDTSCGECTQNKNIIKTLVHCLVGLAGHITSFLLTDDLVALPPERRQHLNELILQHIEPCCAIDSSCEQIAQDLRQAAEAQEKRMADLLDEAGDVARQYVSRGGGQRLRSGASRPAGTAYGEDIMADFSLDMSVALPDSVLSPPPPPTPPPVDMLRRAPVLRPERPRWAAQEGSGAAGRPAGGYSSPTGGTPQFSHLDGMRF
eukprot:TRINITY_DN37860_c0_g1_i1.p1 TRINITY_DN37860_c0_g1~~TRINITY_DN37860_c0_g1_i1.p1  ORF type:complete len:411 (+),score=79.18 TRINITY_DN37860_c0_g1_i1:95-1327(+)